MNRRFRGTGRSTEMKQRFHRYLKPGALAQLRDSRINARQKPVLTPVSFRVSVQNDQVQTAIDGFPCFSVRVFGPRIPQRKKLIASKSVIVSVINSNPSSPNSASVIGENRSDSLMEVFGTDLVVAH